MHLTQKTMKANAAGKRYIIHQGGTGSGKTWSILQCLGVFGMHHSYPTLCITIVAESLPHLKRGTLRDFRSIVHTEHWPYHENLHEHTFTYKNTTIEFLSAAEPDKLRGSRRDILYINECNRVPYESFLQLDMRTRHRTFLDFNPTSRFWVHDELMPTLSAPTYTFTQSTYKDNYCLTTTEVDGIERRKTQGNWWAVYGMGELGKHEGLVFSNWEITASPPSKGGSLGEANFPPSEGQREATLLGYGIDFGFIHSPTVIVQVNECNGELYVHELLYRTNMHNDELFAFAQKHIDLSKLAVADCADAKTIDYLHHKGWTGIQASIKGPDSITHGLQLLLDRKINVTATSTNLIKEFNNYQWDSGYDGKYTNTPIKNYDHGIDALRYLISYPQKKKIYIS